MAEKPSEKCKYCNAVFFEKSDRLEHEAWHREISHTLADHEKRIKLLEEKLL